MRLILFVITTMLSAQLLSQATIEKYWVCFSDKEGVEFNPYEFFDQKAIDRRVNLGLRLDDYADIPVNQNYLSKVKDLVSEMSHHSRWFNTVAVYATDNEISKVSSLPFVQKVMTFPRVKEELANHELNINSSNHDAAEDTLIKYQTLRLGRDKFAAQNIDGSGKRIAVLDAGFTGADVNSSFDHLRKTNRIKKTFDFVSNRENVYRKNNHGTAVLSCIAGIYTHENGRVDTLGLATGAEFLLARTEKGLIEVFSEEENWLAAVEWADQNGADIINSSLGYTGHRYFYSDMDGENTFVSRAGNLAAKKGILVVNSAGNEGASDWTYIGAPADADSVLAVGGLSPWSGVQTPFSSFGPTYDFKLKPNVTAYGHVIAARSDYISETQGTSFSSPLLAGFAACAWQASPEMNNMDLFHSLEKSGDLYPYYDYAHGYGVPRAEYFLQENLEEPSSTFDLTENDTGVFLKLDKSYTVNRPDKTQLEVLFTENEYCQLDFSGYLFYHYRNDLGQISSYKVIDVKDIEEIQINTEYKSGQTLAIHYQGYTQEIEIR